ncbi:MAG: hypothetical protein WBP38_07340 [Hyphomicrobium sp.]|jgi:hypothetical protein|nr:hypothetical protein [Hyphomicrobium sp.]
MAVRKILSTLTLGGLSASALLATGIIFTSNSETVLRDSFSMALSGLPSASPAHVAKSAPVAGTEEYWLTSMGLEGSLPVTKAVSIGDRIGLSVRGQNRELEVSSVAEYAPSVTEIDTRARRTRLILVTARDTGNKDAHPVRFVMEVEQTIPQLQAKEARAS